MKNCSKIFDRRRRSEGVLLRKRSALRSSKENYKNLRIKRHSSAFFFFFAAFGGIMEDGSNDTFSRSFTRYL